MNFFDLHCDTLYKAVTEKSELDNPSYEVKLNNDSKSHRLQCYAIWLPDTLDGNEAEKLFFESADYLKSECNRLGIEYPIQAMNCFMMLSIRRISRLSQLIQIHGQLLKIREILQMSRLKL